MGLPLEPATVPDAFLEERVAGLARRGLRFDPVPEDPVTRTGRPVARAVAWDPGKAIRLEWRSADWKPDAATDLEIRFELLPGGTRVSLACRGWGAQLGDLAPELAGWFARQVAAP